ncbi:MAG: hypothetical protein ABI439_13680 [Rhodospirillales bacterium]
MRLAILAASLLAFTATPALADEDAIVLKNAPGVKQVMENCTACHSVDYIQANSPFLDHGKWEATVKKMIGTYGAPIEAKDAVTIIDYLTANYGG